MVTLSSPALRPPDLVGLSHARHLIDPRWLAPVRRDRHARLILSDRRIDGGGQ